jgi:hypothetical protein
MAPGVLHRVIHGTPSPEQWQRDLITVRPALLQSHRRHRVRGAHYPAIIPTPSRPTSCVRGTLVTGLTEGDIWRLDLFEGDQYSRQTVSVSVLKSNVGLDDAAPVDDDGEVKRNVLEEEGVPAQTYIWQDPVSSLDPEEWDFEEFKRENMRAWMGLDSSDDGDDVDAGFADVDNAVKALAEGENEVKLRDQGSSGNGKPDPMGGRGAGGHITRRLEEAAV